MESMKMETCQMAEHCRETETILPRNSATCTEIGKCLIAKVVFTEMRQTDRQTDRHRADNNGTCIICVSYFILAITGY